MPSTCVWTCQMRRPLATEETEKDIQLKVGDTVDVIGGWRLYLNIDTANFLDTGVDD